MRRELKDLFQLPLKHIPVGRRKVFPYEEGTERLLPGFDNPAHACVAKFFPMRRELKVIFSQRLSNTSLAVAKFS